MGEPSNNGMQELTKLRAAPVLELRCRPAPAGMTDGAPLRG
jgi:hypothetical protein